MPATGFLGIMGCQSLLHSGTLSVQLSMESRLYCCMFCEVQLSLVAGVVSIVSHPSL